MAKKPTSADEINFCYKHAPWLLEPWGLEENWEKVNGQWRKKGTRGGICFASMNIDSDSPTSTGNDSGSMGGTISSDELSSLDTPEE